MAQSGNEVQIPNALVASLTVYNGDDTRRRRRRIAEAETQSLNFLFNQGFLVLKAIVHRHLQDKLAGRNIAVDAVDVKIRPTVESRQDQYRVLTVDNFVQKSGGFLRNRFDDNGTSQTLFGYLFSYISRRSCQQGIL